MRTAGPRGVIAASAGNHAQGVALPAARLGCRALDRHAGDDARRIKVRRGARALGGRRGPARRLLLRREGATRDALAARARSRVRAPVRRPRRDRGAGHGRRWRSSASTRRRSTRSSSPVGGGGLIAGIAAYVKAVRPEVNIIGVAGGGRGRDGPLARRRASVSCSIDVGAVRRRHRGPPGRRARPSGSAASWSTRSWWSTPTRSARRSRTCSTTPARSSSRRGALAIAGLKSWVAAGGARGTGTARRHRLGRQHELRPAALRRRARRARRGARGAARRDDPGAARHVPALLRACSRRAASPSSTTASPMATRRTSSSASQIGGPRRARRGSSRRSRRRLRRARPDRQRARQAARPPHGRRALVRGSSDERLYRFEFPERPGRADALPVVDEPELEHLPVPLPRRRRRLRARPRRHPGAAGDEYRVPTPSSRARLSATPTRPPTRPTSCS